MRKMSKMNLRYHVCGLGYDKNNCVTDYEVSFGDFDTYEEAYALFVKLQYKEVFNGETDIYQMLIQIEECIEDDDYIECVDVKIEWWIINPNYKEV